MPHLYAKYKRFFQRKYCYKFYLPTCFLKTEKHNKRVNSSKNRFRVNPQSTCLNPPCFSSQISLSLIQLFNLKYTQNFMRVRQRTIDKQPGTSPKDQNLKEQRIGSQILEYASTHALWN